MTRWQRVQELRRSGAAGPHTGRDHRSPLTESEAITEGITDMETEYPVTVVTVTVASYADSGAAYTLVYPDGSTRTIGDAEDDYWKLAAIIDGED